MVRISKVQAIPGLRLRVEFSDGVTGEVDLSGRLFGSVFEPLKDPARFAEVTVDEFGVICWPNGADLAPDALYSQLRGSASRTVQAATRDSRAFAKKRRSDETE